MNNIELFECQKILDAEAGKAAAVSVLPIFVSIPPDLNRRLNSIGLLVGLALNAYKITIIFHAKK